MKRILSVGLFAAMLTFALSSSADDGKTQTPQAYDSTQAADQQHPAAKAPNAPAPHINAKSLDDGNDNDGSDDGSDVGQTDGGQKVAPTRAPSGSSGDLPYSDDEMRQADPNNFSPSNKNMPVDQD